MAGIGVLLATILAVAGLKLQVEEDPRVNAVEGMLPGTNCGACGKPGCRAFAESLVEGVSSPAGCSVSSPEGRESIAAFLGVGVGEAVKRVARLACAGGSNVARQRVDYRGLNTCRAASLVAGGGKGCVWGCLGLADCETACTFNAITMDAHDLPVVNEALCTACGDCVTVCPKRLFSIVDQANALWVACNSLLAGDAAEAECDVACTGCGKCAADGAPGLIEIRDGLAVVNPDSMNKASEAAIQRCPTGAILWVEQTSEGTVFRKGLAAKPVLRDRALPIG
ncbi:MAG: 4Fe-4S binding protein [Calditrichaeota bacterium]|nr:4Fe-4S binding protein [Calditrichota bacterium]MCB9473905.1 4Fe-4S binding protein [Candidatus Delongbacteria bacterium]